VGTVHAALCGAPRAIKLRCVGAHAAVGGSWWCAVATGLLMTLGCEGDADGEPEHDAGPDAAQPRDGGAAGASEAPDASVQDAAALDGSTEPPDAGAADDAGPDADRPIVGEDYVDFGALPVPLNGVVHIELEIAPGVRSFVLSADPGATPRRVALVTLHGPDGLWYELGQTSEPTAAGEPPAYVPGTPTNGADGVPYAFAVPSSPERPLLPGRYAIDLYAAELDGDPPPTGTTLQVDAVLQTDAPQTPARLGLLLWTASETLDADALADDAPSMAMLAAATRIFDAAGIELELRGDPQELANADDGFGTLDDDDELDALLERLAERAGPDVVAHAILVDAIATGPGKTVLAKTTGVPGAPAHPMLSRRSAVVLALDELPDNASRAGSVLAHELGHLLGLRHTTEADGEAHDPIADTPECPPELADRAFDGLEPLLSAEDCEDHGGDNLMFYTPARNTALTQQELTEGQRWVLLRSPLVR
jgi:hypothetical protein